MINGVSPPSFAVSIMSGYAERSERTISERADDFRLAVESRLVKRSVSVRVSRAFRGQTFQHFTQSAGGGIVYRLVPRVVGYFRVRSLFYQKQGGVCTPVVKKTDQRGTALAVRCINVRSVLYQFPDYLLVSAPGSGVQGCFRQVVGYGDIGLIVKEKTGYVPVTFQAGVI